MARITERIPRKAAKEALKREKKANEMEFFGPVCFWKFSIEKRSATKWLISVKNEGGLGGHFNPTAVFIERKVSEFEKSHLSFTAVSDSYVGPQEVAYFELTYEAKGKEEITPGSGLRLNIEYSGDVNTQKEITMVLP